MPEGLHEGLTQFADRLPAWLDLLFVVIALYGLFLWLFGSRLVRPTLAFSGMIAGAVIATATARAWSGDATLLPWIIGGAVVGGVTAWLMFRFAMAVALAGLLGLMAPITLLVLVGAGPDARAEIDGVVDGIKDQVPLPEVRVNDEGEVEVQQDEQGDGQGVTEAWTALAERVRTWWTELSGQRRALVISSAGAGVIVGLVIGLIVPKLAAAFLASLAGVVLAATAAGHLIHSYAPKLGESLPGGRIIALALIAAVAGGAVLQWTIFNRSADK